MMGHKLSKSLPCDVILKNAVLLLRLQKYCIQDSGSERTALLGSGLAPVGVLSVCSSGPCI